MFFGRTLTVFRFQAVENASHSTGALYLTLCNNPRSIRFLREETELIMAIPGPNEPKLDQMNKLMDIFVSHLLEAGKGTSQLFFRSDLDLFFT